MTHRSDAEALRARLDERERELRAAEDELDAANQLLWEHRRSQDPVPRGEAGVPKGALSLLGAVLGVAVLAGGLGAWTGYDLRDATLPATTLELEAVVERAGSTPGLHGGDRCEVTLSVADDVLDHTFIRCGSTSIDVPRRDTPDASDHRSVVLDLGRGTIEVRVAGEAESTLALHVAAPPRAP